MEQDIDCTYKDHESVMYVKNNLASQDRFHFKHVIPDNVRSVIQFINANKANAHMNKFDFTTEKIGSVHMTVFEIVAHRNVDNWIQLLT